MSVNTIVPIAISVFGKALSDFKSGEVFFSVKNKNNKLKTVTAQLNELKFNSPEPTTHKNGCE